MRLRQRRPASIRTVDIRWCRYPTQATRRPWVPASCSARRRQVQLPPVGHCGLNANTLLSPATMMRPLTAIGEVNCRTAENESTPPLNTTAPVATSHACSLLVPAAPAIHTTASLPRSSVVVMIGEPWPPLFAHHTI